MYCLARFELVILGIRLGLHVDGIVYGPLI